MKAETFLVTLNQRYREARGASLDLLARHVAEALEEISEDAAEAEADPLDDMLKEDLQALADERGLEVEGSGVDGATLKSDLVAALKAAS